MYFFGEKPCSQELSADYYVITRFAIEGMTFTTPADQPGMVVRMDPCSESGEMSVQQAEAIDSRAQRRALPMYPAGKNIVRWCRVCRRETKASCSRCSLAYCSRTCQKADWSKHVFVCGVAQRPDNADVLIYAILTNQSLALEYEDAAKDFGFYHCITQEEIHKISSTYRYLVTNLIASSRKLKSWQQRGVLGSEIYQRLNPRLNDANTNVLNKNLLSWIDKIFPQTDQADVDTHMFLGAAMFLTGCCRLARKDSKVFCR